LLSIYPNLGICPKCAFYTRTVHNGLDATPLADSSINDQLIKLHSLVD